MARLMPRLPPLLVALVAVPAVHAQSVADRAALEAFRDSIGAVSDTQALLRLEAELIAVARADRDNAVRHLQLGFLAYRVAEIAGSKAHYDDAAGEFEWAAELQPDWPYPWYGLGLAELALGEHDVIVVENVRQMLGKDHLTKAANAFARAAGADPSFAAAVIDLANTALSQRINDRVDVATEAVRLAARGPAGRTPGVQLARGRLEREKGEADSAIAAFQTALAVGADSAIALLELSRSLYFARRTSEGWRAYFAGAAAMRSGEATAAYRGDLEWLASDAELAAFDLLADAAGRAAWLERFWTRRDYADVRETGERLGEHYRRWFYARRHFRLVSRHRHYDITEVYRTAQTEFDDRGVIYLRHGEPDARAVGHCAGCEPNESWLYQRAEGNLVFHFVAREDVQDYKLVSSLVDAMGFRRAVYAQDRTDPVVQELYASRRHFGEPYSRLADGMGMRTGALGDERALGRRSIAVGTTTDSYRHRFELALPVRATDFTVARRSADSPGQELFVVFAIPVGRLSAVDRGTSVQYPVRLRLRVSDTAGAGVAVLDTVRVFTSSQPLPRDAFLSGLLSVPVPPGPLRYWLLVATGDDRSGVVLTRDTLLVPALDGAALAVSDLVIGRVGSGIAWTPEGDTIPLNPLGDYGPGASVELYYEVHGLAAGQEYRTEITLEPLGGPSLLGRIRGLFGGRRAPVSLAFDAVAAGAVTRVRRSIALGDLRRGAYRLTVSVTDPEAGTTYVRQRRIEVLGTAAS